MKKVKPGEGTEMQIHALFEYECFKNGCQHQAYSPICAGGCCASVLHYVRNDRPIPTDPNALILMDCVGLLQLQKGYCAVLTSIMLLEHRAASSTHMHLILLERILLAVYLREKPRLFMKLY